MSEADDHAALAAHVEARGLAAPGSAFVVRDLSGGVSSTLAIVRCGERGDVVVKRALPRLRVANEWLADPRRVATEAHALLRAGALTPGAVPRVLDLDEEAQILVLELAPAALTNWRDELLDGRIDPRLGERLGVLLATWHAASAKALPTYGEFLDTTHFDALRIDPFHRAIAARHPALAPQVDAVVERLLGTKACLVHGDFSPKNVLVDPSGSDVWVLDWEVAHVGDPDFDVGYLLAHLLLKGAHRPADAARYGAVAAAFLAAYGDGTGERTLRASPQLVANVGCLLLARVDGKSPAGYLTAAERDRVRALGVRLLREPAVDILETWGQVA